MSRDLRLRRRPPFRGTQAAARLFADTGCFTLPAHGAFCSQTLASVPKKRSALLRDGERGSFFIGADMRRTAAAVRGSR